MVYNSDFFVCKNEEAARELVNDMSTAEKHIIFGFKNISIDDESFLLFVNDIPAPSRITSKDNSICMTTIRKKNMPRFRNSLSNVNKFLNLTTSKLEAFSRILLENSEQEVLEINLRNVENSYVLSTKTDDPEDMFFVCE